MRRLVLHLLVAVLAFIVGVTAAMLLGRATERTTRKGKCGMTNAVFYMTAEELPPPPPPRLYSCPTESEFSITTLPDVDAPPAPRVEQQRELRIRVTRPDGSVQIIRKSIPDKRP